VFLVGACTYLLLPVDLFVAQVVACTASFYAHVFFDKEYHVEGSRLRRFAWFRRKQELHFVHHRHANSNFAVIHFFWDRILGTYRMPVTDLGEWTPSDRRPMQTNDALMIMERGLTPQDFRCNGRGGETKIVVDPKHKPHQDDCDRKKREREHQKEGARRSP
jgi:hypothetical protein